MCGVVSAMYQAPAYLAPACNTSWRAAMPCASAMLASHHEQADGIITTGEQAAALAMSPPTQMDTTIVGPPPASRQAAIRTLRVGTPSAWPNIWQLGQQQHHHRPGKAQVSLSNAWSPPQARASACADQHWRGGAPLACHGHGACDMGAAAPAGALHCSNSCCRCRMKGDATMPCASSGSGSAAPALGAPASATCSLSCLPGTRCPQLDGPGVAVVVRTNLRCV